MTVSSVSSSTSLEARVDALVDRYRASIRDTMGRFLDGRTLRHYSFMRYHLGWEDAQGNRVEGRTGKLLRPVLCLLSCEAVGGDPGRALPAAASLEFLHNFTLVHDDIQDASPTRHGRDTVWSLWGQALAINVGDGLYALAHYAMLTLTDRGVTPEITLQAASELDEASLRLCEGQFCDLTFEERDLVSCDEYLAMIEGKTAALMAASMAIGALVGGADDGAVGAFREAGRRLGLAFQIRDDVLGVWGDPADTGKVTGEDIWSRKKTYPVVYAMEHASEEDRARLRTLYGATRFKQEAFDEVSAILERSRARAASDEAALRHAEAALAVLEGLNLRPDARERLATLATYFARRPR